MTLNYKTFRLSFTAVFLLVASAMFSNAYAASCSAGTSTLNVADVSFRDSNADDCGGVYSGNNSNQDINALNSGELLFGGTDWGSEIKDDSPGNPGSGTGEFLGINWILSATAGKTGEWTLSIADPFPASLPVTVDFLAVLKGSNSFAAYLFTAETFSATGDYNGTWKINFLNGGDKIPNLSHMSLYLRESTQTIPTVVPIPAAAWLFGLGLLGLIGAARRNSGSLQV
jgi:hypothetical protein